MSALAWILAGALFASGDPGLTVVALPPGAGEPFEALSREHPRVADRAAARALGRKQGAARVCFLRVKPGVWLSLAEVSVIDVDSGAVLEDRRAQFTKAEAPDVLDRLLASCEGSSAFGLQEAGPRRSEEPPKRTAAPGLLAEAAPETEPWRIPAGHEEDEARRWSLGIGLLSSWLVRGDVDAGEAGRSALSYDGGAYQGVQLQASYSGVGLNLFGGFSYQGRGFTSTLFDRQAERFTAHIFRGWIRGGYGVTLAPRLFLVPRLGLELDARAVPVLQGSTLPSLNTLQAQLGIGIGWRSASWELSAGVDGGWILWVYEGAPGSGDDPLGWALSGELSLTCWFSGGLGVGIGGQYRRRSLQFSGIPQRPMPMDERDTASDLRLLDQALSSVVSLKLRL